MKNHFIFWLVPIIVLLILSLSGCSVPSYVKENNLLVANGQTSEAIANYETRIKESPKDADLYYYLAAIFITTKQYQVARETAEKAVLLKPLVDRYRLIAGKSSYYAADYFDAVNHLTNSLLLNQDYLEAYYYLALSYNEIGKTSEALTQLETAIGLEPLYFDAQLLWCKIKYYQLIQQQKSLEIKNISSGIFTVSEDLRTSAYQSMPKDFSTLVIRLEAALKIQPGSVEGNLLLSEIYYAVGASYKAKNILERWLKNKQDDQILLTLAKLHHSAGNFKKALEILEKQKDPDLASKILVLKLKKKLNPGFDWMPEVKNLIKVYDDSTELFLLYGETELQKGNLTMAERLGQRLVNMEPDSAVVHVFLSKVYHAQNDLYGAEWALQKAFNLAPANLDTRLAYLKYLINNGNWSQADAILNNYSLDPQHPDVLFLRGVIAKEKGDYFQAEQLFRKAQQDQYSLEIETQIAEMEIRQGKYHAAEKRLQQIEVYFPGNIEIALIKAELYLKKKLVTQIPRILNPYLTNKLGKGRVHLVLGEALAQEGDIEKGIDILSKGLKLWPRHAEIVKEYTFYLGLTKKYAQAIKILEDMQTFKHKYNQLFYHRLRAFYFHAGQRDKFKAYIYNHKNFN